MNKEKTSNRQEEQWYNAYIQPYNKIKGIKASLNSLSKRSLTNMKKSIV